MPVRSEPWPAGTPCWADISVPDIAAATKFYGEVIGWSFVDTGEEFGHYNIGQVNGRAAAAIGPLQNEGQPSAWTTYLASDDADATAKAITEHGGTVLAEPFDIPDNGRMCVGLDVTGAAFGVWQAKGMIGAEVHSEPGGLAWTDARLSEPDAGREFYAAVFGYRYEAFEQAGPDYRTFHLDGGPLGGMGGMMGAPEGTPSHWVVYFSVADADTAVEAAVRNGGSTLSESTDTPFGRMGFLADPFGAAFVVVGQRPAG